MKTRAKFDLSGPGKIKMPGPRDFVLPLPQKEGGSAVGSANPQSVQRGTVVRLKCVDLEPQEEVGFHVRDGHGKYIYTIPAKADRDGATGSVIVPTETLEAGEYKVVVVSRRKKAKKAEIWVEVWD